MEHVIAALAGGAVAFWFTRARERRRAAAAGVTYLGAVDFLLEEALDAARPAPERRLSRRTDRAMRRLEAIARSVDRRDAASARRG